jgi:nitrogen regulatory protein PII-like uncharacterized protein
MSRYTNSGTKDLDVLKNNINQIVKEVNNYLQKRLEFESNMWGLSKDLKIVDLFSSSAQSQQTQDISKEFQSVWTKAIRKVLSSFLRNSNFNEGAYFDIVLDNEEYEIKTSCAYWTKEWAGNKYSANKVGKHILIKYKVGDYGITELGFYIVDLHQCSKTKWVNTEADTTSFSALKIHAEDIDKVTCLIGEVVKQKSARFWATPVLAEILVD